MDCVTVVITIVLIILAISIPVFVHLGVWTGFGDILVTLDVMMGAVFVKTTMEVVWCVQTVPNMGKIASLRVTNAAMTVNVT